MSSPARFISRTSIGSLCHHITIQQATETQGADGSVIQTWANYCTAYAEIVPLSGSEDYVAQGLSASVIYRITIRYRAGIVPKMCIVWGSREFDIISVRTIDERGRWLVMQCEEDV
jgi:SPP1 family predicted phage head-tail adaptor